MEYFHENEKNAYPSDVVNMDEGRIYDIHVIKWVRREKNYELFTSTSMPSNTSNGYRRFPRKNFDKLLIIIIIISRFV